MKDLFKTIIGPDPSPKPPPELDTKILLGLALIYLAFLILVKGIAADTALSMTGWKYNISEDTLRKNYKGKLWK